MVERSHGEAILVQLTLAGCRVWKEYSNRIGPVVQAVGTPGFPMTGQTRPGLLDDFAEVIHDRSFSSPDPVFWQEAGSFVVVVTAANNKRAQAARGAHDDTQMAAALAVRMSRQPGAQSVKALAESTGGERERNRETVWRKGPSVGRVGSGGVRW